MWIFFSTSRKPESGFRMPSRTESTSIGAPEIAVSNCGLSCKNRSRAVIDMNRSITSPVSLFLKQYVGIAGFVGWLLNRLVIPVFQDGVDLVSI